MPLQVKLSDVVSSVSDILAVHAFSAAVHRGVPGALSEELQALEANARSQLRDAHTTSTDSTSISSGAGAAADEQHELSRAVHAAGAALAAGAASRALEAAMQVARVHVEGNAPKALGALLPSDAPEAVVAAAAAIAAGGALASCAQRLVQQVRRGGGEAGGNA